MRLHRLLAPLSALGLLTLAGPAGAQGTVPERLHLQARIADAGGTPLNGVHFFEAIFYDAPSGGSPLWVEAHQPTFVDGVVSVELGYQAALPATLFEGGELWFTLQLDNDVEMTPRRRIGSVAFARRAAAVEALDASTEVAAGLIDSNAIADGAVTSNKVADNSLDADHLQAGSIEEHHLTAAVVDSPNLADSSVNSDKIKDGSVTSTKLAPNAVGASELAANSVDTTKIVDGAVGTEDIGASAVRLGNLASNSVDTFKIVNGTITSADLAFGAVAPGQIQGNTVTGSQIVNGSISNSDISSSADIDGTKIDSDFGSQNVTLSGNIGIGTTTPASDIHIQSTASVSMFLEADTNNANENDQPSLRMSQDGGLVDLRMGFFNGSNEFELVQEAAEKLHFGSNNARQVTLTPAGDLGIGAQNPAADLHVIGDALEGRIMVAPSGASSGFDSELMLAEDNDGTHGMSVRYDGGDNELQILGENGGTIGPHMTIHRNTGDVTIPGNLTVSGNLVGASGGAAFAYGTVSANATKTGGSSNWSVQAVGQTLDPVYRITLNGVSDFSLSNYGVFVTGTSIGPPCFARLKDTGTNTVDIEMWTSAFALTSTEFNFVVYKY